MARLKRSDLPATIPEGCRRQATGRPPPASVQASACSRARARSERTWRTRRLPRPLPSARRSGGRRDAHDRCADPGHPAEEPRQPPHEVVEERGEVVERLDDDARVVGVPLVDEPRLEVVEVGRQLRPDEPTGTSTRPSPRSSRRASRPRSLRSASRRSATRDGARAGGRRGSGGGGGLDDGRHRQSLPSSAIACSTASRSTMPIYPAVSSMQGRAGFSLSGEGRDEGLCAIVVRTSRPGPSVESVGTGLAHDPARVRHVARARRGRSPHVVVGGRAPTTSSGVPTWTKRPSRMIAIRSPS